ncbi:MAG TPA: very short patch repair endonuclease [Armatimonadota bacterium]|nr:very short patch repair endonuclease [Armatimonadota bacterium]
MCERAIIVDVMKPDQRRKAMRSNRGRTRPERALAAGLWKSGLRYLTGEGYKSRCGRALVGNPDLVFSRKRVAVFVDGCFWHGCPSCGRVPPSMSAEWLAKIRANVERDERVTESLRRDGWTVIRLAEHFLKPRAAMEGIIERLANYLKQPDVAGPFYID